MRETVTSAAFAGFMADFRATVQALHANPATEARHPVWMQFCHELLECLNKRDIRSFLHYPPLVASMVPNDAPYIGRELATLQAQADWASRWRVAIQEDLFGMPTPCRHYPASSETMIHHAHHIARFEAVTGRRIHELRTIVEFGGGYGSFCRLAHNLGFRGRYIVFDLPIFSALQRLFLRSIGLPVRDTAISCVSGEAGRRLIAAELDADPEESVFVATWSLSEIPIEDRAPFEGLAQSCAYKLIAFQRNFPGADNTAYFQRMRESASSTAWSEEPVAGATNAYLFGRPLFVDDSRIAAV